jgi:hypothetical protein
VAVLGKEDTGVRAMQGLLARRDASSPGTRTRVTVRRPSQGTGHRDSHAVAADPGAMLPEGSAGGAAGTLRGQ